MTATAGRRTPPDGIPLPAELVGRAPDERLLALAVTEGDLPLTLSDAQGRRVAMRRLQPAEYLDDTQALQRGLAPGSRTALLFEVEDPGTRAVAFAFDFE